MPKPLIGITALGTRSINPPHLPLYALGQRYVMAVAAAGGVALMVPSGLDEDSARAIFRRLDGFLLPGGGDIDPACYGQAPHAATTEISPDRDRLELALARWAAQADKPLLTICRGTQVLNVALGGTLVQDIPTQLPGSLPHSFDVDRVARDTIAHVVRIDPGTRLRAIMGVDQAAVNSWHHQSLKQVAPDLQVSAHAPDGVIEAVELPGHRFAVGVQWHPEWLHDRRPEMRRLFEALVQAAS